jgi:hypothetical protein
MSTTDPKTWRDRLPASMTDLEDPHGNPCLTPMDRRWLWRLEGFLAVAGTNDALRNMGRDLRQYLNETCDHHWTAYPGDPEIPAHRQCIWCCDVEWTVIAS